MTTRVTTKKVEFKRPFILNPSDGEHPPGIYMVETEEESLDVMSFAAYRLLSTVISRYDLDGSSGFVRFIVIDPAELDAALTRDALVA